MSRDVFTMPCNLPLPVAGEQRGIILCVATYAKFALRRCIIAYQSQTTCCKIRDESGVVNGGREALIHVSALGQCVHSGMLVSRR